MNIMINEARNAKDSAWSEMSGNEKRYGEQEIVLGMLYVCEPECNVPSNWFTYICHSHYYFLLAVLPLVVAYLFVNYCRLLRVGNETMYSLLPE